MQELIPSGPLAFQGTKGLRESQVSPAHRLASKEEMARRDYMETQVTKDGQALKAPRAPQGLGGDKTGQE